MKRIGDLRILKKFLGDDEKIISKYTSFKALSYYLTNKRLIKIVNNMDINFIPLKDIDKISFQRVKQNYFILRKSLILIGIILLFVSYSINEFLLDIGNLTFVESEIKYILFNSFWINLIGFALVYHGVTFSGYYYQFITHDLKNKEYIKSKVPLTKISTKTKNIIDSPKIKYLIQQRHLNEWKIYSSGYSTKNFIEKIEKLTGCKIESI